MRKKTGFTLIELLVVVLIIGILASIAMPQYFRVVERGKATEAMEAAGQISGAQERYLARNGTYYSGTLILPNSSVFDLNLQAFRNFSNSVVIGANGSNSWNAAFTRANGPSYYGNYALLYSAPAVNVSCSGGNIGANAGLCADLTQ